MELIYKVKKPETITRFLQENNVPAKVIEMNKGKPHILVNQAEKSFKDTVKKGDHLHVFIQDETPEEDIQPQTIELDIRYEDEYLLIVNKPAEMQIMTSKAHPTGTLANAIAGYFQSKAIFSQIHYVNRLDKETSGLMIIAKNRFVKFLLSDKTEGDITKEYLCILDGLLDVKRSCIDLPIGRIENSAKREVQFGGEDCQTNYAVQREFLQYSLVKVLSESGRVHQIRVHFAHFNYPIIGDAIYSKKQHKVNTMMLYSSRVSFHHPIKDTEVDVTLEYPKEFKQFLFEHGVRTE